MKSTENFKQAIEKMLVEAADKDTLFAKSFANPTKTIEGCCNYILETVQKSKVQGYTDEEVYGMAFHYYDEPNIADSKPVDCHVVVNHTVQLTPEEIANAKEQARKEVFAKHSISMKQKKVVHTKIDQPLLF